jgi:DNA-binding Lrp family transcriptional regulator
MAGAGKREKNAKLRRDIAAAFDERMARPVLILRRDQRARLYRELAEEFGASERTVIRAVERYSKAGTGR